MLALSMATAVFMKHALFNLSWDVGLEVVNLEVLSKIVVFTEVGF